MAHDVFRHYARDEKLQKVIAPAGFGPATTHFESTKGMSPYDCAGAGTVNVNIPCY
jgi:hypothetical protein